MLKEKQYGTIKIYPYSKKHEVIGKCFVYLSIDGRPKIRECELDPGPEVKGLIEETMVDVKGNILNSGATFDPGGGLEGGYEWEIEGECD
jgi:hypothetical protein